MKAVSEATNWSQRSSTEAKYTALRCDLQPLTPGSSEFCRVRDQILNSQDWYGNQTLPEMLFNVASNSSLNLIIVAELVAICTSTNITVYTCRSEKMHLC